MLSGLPRTLAAALIAAVSAMVGLVCKANHARKQNEVHLAATVLQLTHRHVGSTATLLTTHTSRVDLSRFMAHVELTYVGSTVMQTA